MAGPRYSIADEVFQKYPGYVRGVVIAHDLANGPSPAPLVDLLREAEAGLRARLNLEGLAEEPRIKNWREAYRAFVEAGWPALACDPAVGGQGLPQVLNAALYEMLAVGRALMADPKLLMLDEPSLGLAPLVVREVFRTIEQLREGGTSILLIEQNARAALEVADHGYVLEMGEIALEGPADELAKDSRVIDTYLGAARQKTTA